MVGKRFELLRIAAAVSRNFRLKTNFPYSTFVSAAPSRQKWSYFSDGLELEGGSSVYEHALKFQRPSTIKYSHGLNNSVSLIGRVARPLKRVNSTDYLGVYTVLRVLGTCHPDRCFWILLKMWGYLAQECLNHMKEYDLIYVNGHLVSKGVEDGISYEHEVIVKEINYVAPVIGQESSGKTENSLMRGEDDAEQQRSRLHLWEVFFASPYEWRDLRKSKTNPRQPDFKRRSTGEALWLSRHDPPWLRQQLQKLDSAMKDQSPEDDQRPYLAGEDDAEWQRSRLHLWQVFFASPYEWRDLRMIKTNPRQPDFKHKSTGEALWLSRRDPPWLRQQLQKLDSAMKDPEDDQRPYLAGHFL